MKLGISFIAVGVFLIPFGVLALLEEYKEYKEMPMNERIQMMMQELTALTGGIGGLGVAWILGLSLLLIIGGCAVLLDYYNIL